MGRFWRSRADKRYEDIIRQLAEHAEKLDDMEHIEVEWSDWFEKFKNLYSRLNRRVERDEAKVEAPPEEPISPQALRIFGSRRV